MYNFNVTKLDLKFTHDKYDKRKSKKANNKSVKALANKQWKFSNLKYK